MKLSLRQKITLRTNLLVCFVVLFNSLSFYYFITVPSFNEIRKNNMLLMKGLVDAHCDELSANFTDMQYEVKIRASEPYFVNFFNEINAAVKDFQKQTQKKDIGFYREELKKQYGVDFLKEYEKQNPGSTYNTDKVFPQNDELTILLQYAFIKNNEHPIGKKNELVNPNDGSDYAKIHEKHHNFIKNYVEKMGFYDLFLVEAETGRVIYTDFKELDFGRSLRSPEMADTGLAKTFEEALKLKEEDDPIVSDFAPYWPSYSGQAGFVAHPIFSEGKKVGVLIIQAPIDRINNVLIHGKDWQGAGLEKTGESYAVGIDGKTRTESRLFIEDKKAFFEKLKNIGVDQDTIKTIDSKNSSIGIYAKKTEYVKNVIEGKSGTEISVDDEGHSVLVSYRPLKIGSTTWGIIFQSDENEAMKEANRFQKNSIYLIIAIVLSMNLLTFIVSMFLAKYITLPIEKLRFFTKEISNGNLDVDESSLIKREDELGHLNDDLVTMRNELKKQKEFEMEATAQEKKRLEEEKKAMEANRLLIQDVSEVLLSISEGDLTKSMDGEYEGEFVQLKEYLNDTVERLTDLLNKIRESGNIVGNGINDIRQGNIDLSQRTEEQASSLAGTAASMEELSITVKKNAEQAKQASDMAKKVSHDALEGREVVNNVTEAMSHITESSKRMVGIIGTIDEIAFQTNLLALNAAVEAARAGEQGRGFAVVASEVRNLAQRSAGAAREIRDLINNNVERIEHGNELSMTAQKSLEIIIQSVREVTDAMEVIATTSEEQSIGIAQVNRSVSELDTITQQNAALVEESTAAYNGIADQANEMMSLLNQFRFSKAGAGKPSQKASRPQKKSHKNDNHSAHGHTGATDHSDEWEEF